MESQDPNSMTSDERWLLYLMKGKIVGKMKKPVEESLVSSFHQFTLFCSSKHLVKLGHCLEKKPRTRGSDQKN